MADEVNWGSLYDDAGDADKPIPNGVYDVEVTKCEAKQTKTGKPMFSLSAKILGGPQAGRFIWHNITVTVENPNAMRMFFLNMAAFGLRDDFFKRSPAPSNSDVAAALVGRKARFDVGVQTSGMYTGRNEVKKVGPPSGAPTPSPAGLPGAAPVPVPSMASVPSVPVPSVPAPAPDGPGF